MLRASNLDASGGKVRLDCRARNHRQDRASELSGMCRRCAANKLALLSGPPRTGCWRQPMPRRPARFSSPAFQPALSRVERRATGVYYTPCEIVQLIVGLTLDPPTTRPRPPRVLAVAWGAAE